MASGSSTLRSSRLRQLAQRPQSGAGGGPRESCDLCSAPIAREHRHLLDLRSRELMCCCQPCKILFDRDAAGGSHYRLIPDRRLRIDGFRLDDAAWEDLRIPVDMAFFFHHGGDPDQDGAGAEPPQGRPRAFYPGPMGATESLLELSAWDELARDNPILAELEPDVEALLVNRARGACSYWLVPIDDCYDLVGLIRTRWRGLTGGKEVWEEIGRFFERLERRALAASSAGTGNESTAPAARSAGRREEDPRWATT